MTSFLASPWFLLTTAFAVPALILIYWLRSRSRRMPVSSLLLWNEQKDLREGGLYFEYLRTPLLFFLELLILLLLIVAAAGPTILSWKTKNPIVLVLDDSFSMTADNNSGTPRARALQELKQQICRAENYPMHIIIAGTAPYILENSAQNDEQLFSLLKNWKCRDAHADLKKALTIASELSGGRARILVLSDHAPIVKIPKQGKIQWRAYGSASGNITFVNAGRTTFGDKDRCMFEVANFSDKPISTVLQVEIGGENPMRKNYPLTIKPRKRVIKTLEITPMNSPVKAKIVRDALPYDNEINLLHGDLKKVRVKLQIEDSELKSICQTVLELSRIVIIGDKLPQLIITDKKEATNPDPDIWFLHIKSDGESLTSRGPFIVDYAHPLSLGLSLGGVLWGRSKKEQIPGVPIISTGNVPLLTDFETPGENHHFYLQFYHKVSNIQRCQNWPILYWNLLQWRRSNNQGPVVPNLRLGLTARFKTSRETTSVTIIDPDNNSRIVPVVDTKVSFLPEVPGIYRITSGKQEYSLSVNILAADESDISKHESNAWGDWADQNSLDRYYENIAWAFSLAALIFFAIITLLIFYRKGT